MFKKTSKKITTIIMLAVMCFTAGVVPVCASEIPTANAEAVNADGTENTSSSEQFRLMMQQYYHIPSSVRTLLADNGISIQFVSQETVTTTRKNLKIDQPEEAGLWIKDLKLIEVGSGNAVAGIGHEIGHALDSLLSISSSNNFQVVYEQEKDKLTLTGAVFKIDSASEFFAEAFNVYTVNSSLLQENCPKTYAYIEASVSQAALVKNANFIDTANTDAGVATVPEGENTSVAAETSTSDAPTPESLGTSWDTYNPDEILKLPYINTSETAMQLPTYQDNVKSVFNGFLQLPANIIQGFIKSGWSFEIVTGDEIQNLYNEYLSGASADGVNSAIFISLHKVYVRAGSPTGTENTKFSLSYFVDQIYRENNDGVGASDTDTFKAIFEAEGSEWKEKNQSSSAMQYFASSVSSYLSNEEGFTNCRPMTAAYVTAALNSYANDSASIDNLLLAYQMNTGSSLPQNKTEETTTTSTADTASASSTATAVNQSASTAANDSSVDLSAYSSSEKAAAAAAILASNEVCIGYDPGNVTKTEEQAKLSIVVDAFNKVPRSVQKLLGSKHVGITMEDPGATSMKAFMNGQSEEVSEHVVGLWLPHCRGISVGYNTADVTTCHEVGHALDEYTGLSQADEWEALYATEVGQLQSSGSQNYASSAEEFFREAFNQYCLRRDLLKQTCPGVYAYIDTAVASLG